MIKLTLKSIFIFSVIYAQYPLSPEKAGLSKNRLNKFNRVMHSLVDEGKLAGVQTAIIRNGVLGHYDTYGFVEIENKAPLSPHIQIYKWHISSLVSITHRITGIINIIGITFICLLVSLLILGENNYEMISLFLSSMIGKFIILGLTWSFSFQILSEIRHLIMDLGYGFDLKVTKITGLIVIIGSIVLMVVFYLIGKNFF